MRRGLARRYRYTKTESKSDFKQQVEIQSGDIGYNQAGEPDRIADLTKYNLPRNVKVFPRFPMLIASDFGKLFNGFLNRRSHRLRSARKQE
jgi:hypothetical protein